MSTRPIRPQGRSDSEPGAPDQSRFLSQTQISLVVAEYSSLRTEILKLIELQAQLVSLSVLAVGTVLGVAIQTKNSSLAFVYPLLSLILGIAWLNHSHAISRCAAYLSQELEPRFGGVALGWERFVRRTPLRFGKFGYWGIRSVFVLSSVTAIYGGWTLVQEQGDLASTAQLIVGVVSTVVSAATLAIFALWREASPESYRKAAECAKGSDQDTRV